MSRASSAIEISGMVTGLVTVNGNNQAANGENTERRHGQSPAYGSIPGMRNTIVLLTGS